MSGVWCLKKMVIFPFAFVRTPRTVATFAELVFFACLAVLACFEVRLVVSFDLSIELLIDPFLLMSEILLPRVFLVSGLQVV